MSLHDEWSLINIIMLLGCVSLTPLHLLYAYADLFPQCFVSLGVILFTVHIPRPLFPFSTLSLPVVVALKADHMTKETMDVGS